MKIFFHYRQQKTLYNLCLQNAASQFAEMLFSIRRDAVLDSPRCCSRQIEMLFSTDRDACSRQIEMLVLDGSRCLFSMDRDGIIEILICFSCI
jgi:hypothetical protein